MAKSTKKPMKKMACGGPVKKGMAKGGKVMKGKC